MAVPVRLHSVSAFEAKCAHCGEVFSAPSLGDFGYGTFLLFGELGTVYAVLDAVNSSVWQQIASELSTDDGNRILNVVAAVADRVQGQGLRAHHACPACLSRKWESWEGRRIGVIEIGEATFSEFISLTEGDRRQRIHSVR
jgi:hypothetical protein